MKNSVSILILLLIQTYFADSNHFTLGSDTKISCPSYSCAPQTSSYCLGTGDKTYYSSECPENSYCSHSGLCTDLKSKYKDPEAYPGESCSGSTPCKSGSCISGICQGKALGDTCLDDLECNPGLRCHHTCKPLFKSRQRGCLTDFDCEVDSGCNFGECFPYFSLLPDEKLEKCENFFSFLCKSSMCNHKKCIKNQKLPDFPKECSSDSDCKSQDGYFSTCVCGLNAQGMSFCLSFPGDQVGKEYLHSLTQWITSKNAKKCNTRRRFTVACMNNHWEKCLMVEYLYRAYRYQDFPAIIDNPTCVEKSLTQDYWKIREVYRIGGKICDDLI